MRTLGMIVLIAALVVCAYYMGLYVNVRNLDTSETHQDDHAALERNSEPDSAALEPEDEGIKRYEGLEFTRFDGQLTGYQLLAG